MKKLFVLFIVVLFAAPAMAVDWNFYGSARMATYWTDTDLGDPNNNLPNGDDDDTDLIWDLQGNSRLGANVKAEAVRGQFEFGITESNVTSRRIYGTWDFGPATLKVGKDYTPVKQFISGQAFGGDLGLLGVGTAYGSRFGQIGLNFGGFELALITPTSSDKGATNGDVDETFPKIEAAYTMAFDMFSFKINGGYQTYEVDGGSAGDFDVDSYTVGLDVGVNFGPGYVKGAVNYGENVGDAGWHIPENVSQGGLSTLSATSYDVDDVETLMYALVAGWKFTDMVSVEAGVGYREDSPDASGLEDDEVWSYYLQAPLRLAPGVTIIPEFGYYDFEDDINGDDEGDSWYFGGKWQIDF